MRENTTSACVLLQERVFSIKKRCLSMYKKANAGHIGSSLSCAELLVFIHYAWMKPDDSFVLSKGHAAALLYSLLAEQGLLSEAQIETFYEDGTQLAALPPFNAIKQIPFATGSLGYGLSLSAGMAFGNRLKRKGDRFFCVTSDGELNEGSVWEAALFIAHHKLKDLIWIIDRNGIQAIGRTEEVMALEPLDAKLRAFGFHVIVTHGHDFTALLSARDECLRASDVDGRPVVILANTFKGNGISFMHDTIDSHYLPMSDTQYELALSELTRDHERLLNDYHHAG